MSFSSVDWSSFGTERQYPTYRWMELARSADYLCRKILDIHPGENIVIYADTATDPRIVNATAAAIHTIGAHAVVVWYATRGDIDLPPPKPVEAAVLAADLVIEYAVAYLVHSEMWRKAREAGIPMQCLTGMNVDMMVRTINPDNYEKMQEFGRAYTEALRRAKSTYKITSPAGTNITIKAPTPEELAARAAAMVRPTSTGVPRRRGGMLGGQGMIPSSRGGIDGTIVFDGAIWPPSEIGAIKKPIELKVESSIVKEINGGYESRLLKNWFAHFNDPRAYTVNHVSTGFNPGVKRISGDIVEDERVFGSVEIGIGMTEVPCHTDGIILEPSVWADDTIIENEGVFQDPILKKMAKDLGMQLWVE